MILRKPYAFIIKNFRLLHLIMLACTIFLTYKMSNLYTLINNFITKDLLDSRTDLIGYYLSNYMYLAIVLIVLVCGILIFLFVWKKANFKYYAIQIGYYVLILIGMFIMKGFLETIVKTSLDTRVLKLYRDSLLLFMIPSFYFIFKNLINTIGFNLKKFDFSKDLKSLQAETKDNEEFEFVVGKNGYKYKRRVRKMFREFSYYVKENVLLFSILSGVLVVGLGVGLYLKLYVYNAKYDPSQSVNVNGLTYTVKESYLTNRDYAGKLIDKSDHTLYLVVKLSIENKDYLENEITLTNYRVLTDDESVSFLPTTSRGNYFIDLGDPNIHNKIPANTTVDYLFIYEMSDEYRNGSYYFSIVSNESTEKSQKTTKRLISLKPEIIEDVKTEGIYGLKEKVTFDKSNLKDSNLTILSYEIKDKFTEKYQYQIKNKSFEATEIVKPSSVGSTSKKVLKLNLDYYIDYSSNLYGTLLDSKTLFNSMGTITYVSRDNQYKTEVVKSITPSYVSDSILYLEIPAEAYNSPDIYINITVRDKKYAFVLKG